MAEFRAERLQKAKEEAQVARGIGINLGGSSPIVLPHDAQAEGSVLSAMLASEDVLRECLLELHEDDFFLGRNRIIFGTLLEFFDKNLPTDPISLVNHLASEGTLERVGGASYINDLANNTFSLVAWRHHVELLRRDSLLREMIVAAAHISALAMDAPENTKEVVDAAEKLLYSATSRDVQNAATPVKDAMMELFGVIAERNEQGNRLLGLSTGYPTIDRFLMGLKAGQLMVIGARPAMGKTSLALNLSIQAASTENPDAGASVAIFSLEMSTVEIAQRLLAVASGVNHSAIVQGTITENQWPEVINASRYLSNLDIVIDDTPGTTVTEIRAKARRLLHDKPRGLVVVDYLQLLSSPRHRGAENRATEVAEMSRGLKIMAKDLGVPVIALSQLNRQVTGAQRRPQLSDLRESGSIEQDADIVILLDKSQDQEEGDESDPSGMHITDFIIAKNRSGPTGVVPMGFVKSTTRFYEIDEHHQDAELTSQPVVAAQP